MLASTGNRVPTIEHIHHVFLLEIAHQTSAGAVESGCAPGVSLIGLLRLSWKKEVENNLLLVPESDNLILKDKKTVYIFSGGVALLLILAFSTIPIMITGKVSDSEAKYAQQVEEMKRRASEDQAAETQPK